MRNMMDAESLQGAVNGCVRAIREAPDLGTARLLLAQTMETVAPKASKAMKVLEERFDDAAAMVPEYDRRRFTATNNVERMNAEMRRRERVNRIFPNCQSVERLIGALLMEIDEKWSSRWKYDRTECVQKREVDARVRKSTSNMI
jgi:putative transposase